MMKRPQSIRALVQDSGDARAFWYNVLEFVDELRRLRDPAMLSDEPPLLAGHFRAG